VKDVPHEKVKRGSFMTSDTNIRPNVFPVLRYRDAPAAIAWLKQAFGFEPRVEVPGPNGTIAHAELKLGPGAIGLSSWTPEDPKNPWSAVDQGVYVCVSDPDAHHDRAKAAGASIVLPLKDQDYGSRDYSVRDLEGHLWCFGTYSMTDMAGVPNMYPGLKYQNGTAAIDWLTRAFGFKRLVVIPGPDETIAHAELTFGQDVIMLGSTTRPNDAEVSGGARQSINVTIDDPDAHHARAVKAGAKIVVPLADTHYGARAYSAHDLEGHVWTFGTYRPVLEQGSEITRSAAL
jgi:uncharacterized glyoxalase superfamily protein PhnB